MMTLAELNERPDDEVRPPLLACCSSRRWADAMLAGRPYVTEGDLLAANDAAVALLTRDDLREALDGHPRIGATREAGGWSGQEQAGVSEADAVLMRELAEGNAAYEEKFGHLYLVCATGRSGDELLELLRQRMGNSAEDEWEVVAGELAKINGIRLRELAADQAGGEA
jgi:2-oxo-4-hydroxy-4-carboxy-5-ureidoimidazoline decarboxylase